MCCIEENRLNAQVEQTHTLNGSGNAAHVDFAPAAPEEISFSDVLTALSRRKRTIAAVVLATAVVSTVVSFVIPIKYSAEAVILTPQQSQSSLSALAALSGAGAGAGLSSLSLLSGFGFRTPTDLYVGILESRTIADKLIAQFDLRHVYKQKDAFGTRKRLAQNTTITAGRNTLIHIRVEDHDAKRAAALANAYVQELSLQNSTVALTEASQRRLFYEHELAKEKDALAAAEVAMRDTQQSTGLIVPGGQAEALIRSVSQLRLEILNRQAQLEGMKSYVSDDNPRFQMIKRELGTLQTELTKLEKGKHQPGTPDVAAGQLPQAGLEYLRKYRDVKYHETLYELLAKQYEAARLDEAKSAPLVQVIDGAVIPDRKSWPPRALLVILAASFAALATSFWIVLANGGTRRGMYVQPLHATQAENRSV
jgi:tyrosine-protein kinase Etk/Wzc